MRLYPLAACCSQNWCICSVIEQRESEAAEVTVEFSTRPRIAVASASSTTAQPLAAGTPGVAGGSEASFDTKEACIALVS